MKGLAMIEFNIGDNYRVIKGVYQHCSGDCGKVYFNKNYEFTLKEIHNITSEAGVETKLLMECPKEFYKVFVSSNIVTTILKDIN